MNWRLKSAIQRFCGALPVGSDVVYYGLQRHLGSLRHPPEPTLLLHDTVEFADWLRDCGLQVKGMRCLEVGTGRRVDIPFALYLLGAARIDTYDLNRYLKSELVDFSLDYIRRERQALEPLFLSAAADPDECRARIDRLLSARGASDAMKVAGITYHAPADAAKSGLPAGSVDLHCSYTVDEHIPAEVQMDILKEARRVLSPSGVLLHHVDPSDHFSHDDATISAVHFLRFTDAEWSRIAGNKYGYHNRLRAHQFIRLFETAGFSVLRQQTRIDERALDELRNGFPLAAEFRDFTPEQLSARLIRILAKPNPAAAAAR
jgi:hypothetical protein